MVAIYNFHDKTVDIPLSFDDLGVISNSGYGVRLTDVITGEKSKVLTGGRGHKLEAGGYKILKLRLLRYNRKIWYKSEGSQNEKH